MRVRGSWMSITESDEGREYKILSLLQEEKDRLGVPILSQADQEIRNRLAAIALYKTVGGFGHVEDEDYGAF